MKLDKQVCSLELARALKNAGFPKMEHNFIDNDMGCTWCQKCQEDYDDVKGTPCPPSLEELIEACGDEIEALTQEHSRAGNEWIASSFNAIGGKTRHCRAPTPTEAVARLWIALNRKGHSPASQMQIHSRLAKW